MLLTDNILLNFKYNPFEATFCSFNFHLNIPRHIWLYISNLKTF